MHVETSRAVLCAAAFAALAAYAAPLYVGQGETLRHASGVLKAAGNDPAFEIGGPKASDRGVFLLEGGTVEVHGNLRVGGAGAGTMRQTAGTVNVDGYLVVARWPGSTGEYRLEGGVENSPNLCVVVGEEGTGTLTVANGGVLRVSPKSVGPGKPNGGVWVAYRPSSMGTVRLAKGGRIEADKVRLCQGDATFVFDGGELVNPPGANGRFIIERPSGRILVGNGGACIDAGTGDCAIEHDIAAEPGATAGDFVKTGTGRLALTGRNTWRGRTIVKAGKLDVESAESLPGWDRKGGVEIAEGAQLECGPEWTPEQFRALQVNAVNGARGVRRAPRRAYVPLTSESVKLTGEWHAGFDGRAPAAWKDHVSTYAWRTVETGAAVEFAFTGTEVDVGIAPRAPHTEWGLLHRDAEQKSGMVDVYLDGQKIRTIDSMGPGEKFSLAKNLPAASHVVKLVNTGRGGKTAPVSIRGFWVDVPQRPSRDWNKEDSELKAEVAKLPPVLYLAESPILCGAIPNTLWQSNPEGRWGCAIKLFDPAHPDAGARTVFAHTNSAILDMSLSFDAKKILFSMRKDRARTWQIYEIGVDGQGLRQLTDTPGAHNASPAYLPGGRIAFLSTRTPGYHTVCQSGPSAHVHVMDADGAHVKRLSSNTLSDVYLGLLSDGRLVYTRWEYVDWNLTYRQSLWTQYPDGRQMALWFGNLAVDPASYIQAAEFPDGYGALATAAPHHGSSYGAIHALYNRTGPEGTGPESVKNWTPEFPCIYDRNHVWAWAWPHPLSQSRALACRGFADTHRFKIMLLADDGRRATVCEEAAASCLRPIALVPRKTPRTMADFAPEHVNTYTLEAAPPGQPARETVGLGRLVVSDVYKGLDGKVAPGEARYIRVMEQMPKTVNRSWNGVLDQGPLLGASSYYAKRVWTYAPVAEDGSVHLEAPALKEIYLQLVDAEGRELRRMTSAINLMPGETQSCTGCHENRRTAAVPLATSAARRAPTPITPPDWGNAGVIDYAKTVQPVFDRWCVKCHSGATPPKGVALTGGYTRFFNRSYDSLVLRSKSDAASRAYFTGKSAVKPLVQGMHLLTGLTDPFEVKESGSHASRLPEYLEKKHCGAEIPLADRRRVYEWIDAQMPYYATSDHAHVRGKSGRDKWGVPGSEELRPWFTQRFLPLYAKNCASCHGEMILKPGLSNRIETQWWWFDLTCPAWSPALTAHLPKAAGGRGVGTFAFTGRDDPRWKELSDIARAAADAAWETPEADMPGFVPLSKGKCEFRP